MDFSSDTLGGLIRAWRDRLAPQDAGITVAPSRRATGLRREELASLAGLSVDYVVRLEQGRARNPSAQVIGAMARALHLTNTERDHLYRVAGLLPPADDQVSTHIPPGVQRLVARLDGQPLAVFSAEWDLLAWNPHWSALQGDPIAIPVAERNLARAVFGDGEARRSLRPSRSENGSEQFEAAIVADLRTAVTTYPADASLRHLVRELRTTSRTFDAHWKRASVGRHTTDRKTIAHPDVGTMTLDCDVVTVPGSDLRIIVYSAAAGSSDAEKLAFVGVTRNAHITTSA
ncbi:transcriptional regulator [Curtobacterium sp. MCPF17_003]|uniref:helix-turn-helix transcriptional regulator n=1 Tax=Curtobacterium sp. MCPF17_003 TaxID=2175637 RepID=UPI000D8FC27B|nr:helix-turn-helix transcriptional regulator [Curtobacterium sp. MCPF17_003]PYY64427.1 transcriptional regulator [Curtobacterium sp. MCPF17_003]